MKLGILGTGMIVQDFLTTADKLDIDSYYILGRASSKEKTEALAKRYHLARCFYDYDDLLQSDADTIYVGLPNVLHYPFAKKALQAGKHVIVEKPAAVTLAEWEELSALAKEKDLLLLEAMTTPYLPAYRALKAELEKIGQVRMVTMDFCQYSSRYERFLSGETPPAFDPNQAGGALMDLNVYNIHFLTGLFGAPKRVQYTANIQRGIDTSGAAALDYGSFQAVSIAAKDCGGPIQTAIRGEKGSLVIRLPANRFDAYSLYTNDGTCTERNFSDGAHRMAFEFREFVSIIREHDRKRCDELLTVSGEVLRILETCRKQAGLSF